MGPGALKKDDVNNAVLPTRYCHAKGNAHKQTLKQSGYSNCTCLLAADNVMWRHIDPLAFHPLSKQKHEAPPPVESCLRVRV